MYKVIHLIFESVDESLKVQPHKIMEAVEWNYHINMVLYMEALTTERLDEVLKWGHYFDMSCLK